MKKTLHLLLLLHLGCCAAAQEQQVQVQVLIKIVVMRFWRLPGGAAAEGQVRCSKSIVCLEQEVPLLVFSP